MLALIMLDVIKSDQLKYYLTDFEFSLFSLDFLYDIYFPGITELERLAKTHFIETMKIDQQLEGLLELQYFSGSFLINAF
jgi:hypothetical protein